jgi:hypothetical protein
MRALTKKNSLNKIITELWCEESKYLPLHCILHAEAKKGRKSERTDLQPEDDNPNPTPSLG